MSEDAFEQSRGRREPTRPLESRSYADDHADMVEFQEPWNEENVLVISQAEAKIVDAMSEKANLFPGITDCVPVIVKNSKGKVGVFHTTIRGADANLNGQQVDELLKLGGGEALILRGAKSDRGPGLADQLELYGVNGIKEIPIDSGKQAWDGSYRANEDKVYVENRSKKELQFYQGFGS